MTPAERRAWRIDKWRNPDVPWASPEAEADYKARVDRILAAINLEKPDRVPVRLNMGFWPAKSAGHHRLRGHERAAKRAAKAWKDFNLKFQPDASVDPLHNTVPAAMFEALDYKLYSWPGHGVSEIGQLPVQRERVDAPRGVRPPHLRPDRLPARAPTCPARSARSPASAVLSSFFDYIELPFVFGQVVGWGSDEMVASLEKMTAAAESRQRVGQGRFPAMGEVMGARLPAVRRLAPPRRPSTSWATPCAAPRASSSTCSASPTRSWPRATA